MQFGTMLVKSYNFNANYFMQGSWDFKHMN